MEAAEYLQQTILDAFKNSMKLSWPPIANELDYSPPLPPQFKRSLEYMISGSNTFDCSEHVKGIILLIGQDICDRVSNGKQKRPKHILLASKIRHLYCGKKLVTIMSRMGHCEPYNYISELDNTMTMVLEDVLGLVTSQIVSGKSKDVFQMEQDNLNKVTTNTHGNK